LRVAYLVAAITVAVVTAIGIVTTPVTSHADQAMAYLLAVLVAALGGRGPGLAAAVLSAACFDFFFVEPVHTFAIADRSFLITFAVMLATGVAIGSLVNRMKVVEKEIRTEELRSTLLSSVSHDMRTPLATITGVATSLRDEAKGNDREQLDTIVEEAQRLSRIVANLLAITRVETGAQPKREWVPLDELVGPALQRLDKELVHHPVTVSIKDESAFVDPILFEQLLSNLVENAAKHTPVGVPIEIRAKRAARATVLEVVDKGPGLPDGPAERVFDKFYRGPDAAIGGVGLGLAVCRAIAAAHGGKIQAVSRENGALFRVWFPDDGAPPRLEDLEDVA
jgi:two-component system sensor histidine kinase KdpD